ncbi:uncharacterized protein LOC104858463 [Fukomys damarensis]|uniref:uncharacterized protein LOC104858463 n=1 Tax=Fukomys damarensis TaxID=885580 RepID=UPI001455C8F4|nr:uncharacterized protein LOC104858463 [Fukomys damarensis]
MPPASCCTLSPKTCTQDIGWSCHGACIGNQAAESLPELCTVRTATGRPAAHLDRAPGAGLPGQLPYQWGLLPRPHKGLHFLPAGGDAGKLLDRLQPKLKYQLQSPCQLHLKLPAQLCHHSQSQHQEPLLHQLHSWGSRCLLSGCQLLSSPWGQLLPQACRSPPLLLVTLSQVLLRFCTEPRYSLPCREERVIQTESGLEGAVLGRSNCENHLCFIDPTIMHPEAAATSAHDHGICGTDL